MLIRSTAAGGRLGGLAAATREAAEALAPAFDVVVVETVGVGQSETDVEEVCDTVAVVVQPASGDALQFLKAGIMEVPDLLVVTKADLGDAGRRARGATSAQALAAVGSGERAGAGGVVAAAAEGDRGAGGRARRAPRAARTWPSAACAPAAAPRCASSRPSTASARCAPSAGRREAERLLARQDPSAA